MFSFLPFLLIPNFWISLINSKSTLLGIDTSSSSSSIAYLPMIEKLKVQYEELKLSLDMQLHQLSSTINKNNSLNEASLASLTAFQHLSKKVSLLNSEQISLQNQYSHLNATYSLSISDLSSNFSSALAVSNSILAKAIGEVNSTHNSYQSNIREDMDYQLSNITLLLDSLETNFQQNISQIEVNMSNLNDQFNNISSSQAYDLSLFMQQNVSHLYNNITQQLVNISDSYFGKLVILNDTLQDRLLQYTTQQEKNLSNQIDLVSSKIQYLNTTLQYLSQLQDQIWYSVSSNVTATVHDFFNQSGYTNLTNIISSKIDNINHSFTQSLSNVTDRLNISLLGASEDIKNMNSSLAASINALTDDIAHNFQSVKADHSNAIGLLNTTLMNDSSKNEQNFNSTNDALKSLSRTVSTNLSALDTKLSQNISFINSSWYNQFQQFNDSVGASLFNITTSISQLSDKSESQQAQLVSTVQTLNTINESLKNDLNSLIQSIDKDNQQQSALLISQCNSTMVEYTDNQLTKLNQTLLETVRNTNDTLATDINHLQLLIDTQYLENEKVINDLRNEQIIADSYIHTNITHLNTSLSHSVAGTNNNIDLINQTLSSQISLINNTLSTDLYLYQQTANRDINIFSTFTLPNALTQLSNNFSTVLEKVNSTLYSYTNDYVQFSMDKVTQSLRNSDQYHQQSIYTLNSSFYDTLNVLNTTYSNQIIELQLKEHEYTTAFNNQLLIYNNESILSQQQNHQQVLQQISQTHQSLNQSISLLEQNISTQLLNHIQTHTLFLNDISALQSTTQNMHSELDKIQSVTIPSLEQFMTQFYHNITTDTKNVLKVASDSFHQIQRDIEMLVAANYSHIHESLLQLTDASKNTSRLLMIDIMPRLAVHDYQLQLLSNQTINNMQYLSHNLSNQILDTNQQLLSLSSSLSEKYQQQASSVILLDHKLNTIQNYIITSIDVPIQSILYRMNEIDKVLEKNKIQSETLFDVYFNLTKESRNGNILAIQEIKESQNQLKQDYLISQAKIDSFQLYTNQTLYHIFNQLSQLQQHHKDQTQLQTQQLNISNEYNRNLIQSSNLSSSASITAHSAHVQSELKSITQQLEKVEQSHIKTLESLPLELLQKTDQSIQTKLIPYLTKDSESIHFLNTQLTQQQDKIKQQDDKIRLLEVELATIKRDCVASSSLDTFRKEFQALQSSFIAHSGKVLEVVTASLHK